MTGNKADQSTPASLSAIGLTHRYAGQGQGLGPIGMELWPGRITALVGANGAGKSTLLRLLAGVLTPRSGTIEVGGVALRSLGDRARARVLALAPQRTSLAFAYTVREYVGFGAYAAGRRGVGEAVDWALDELDLATQAGSPLPRLSVGQQQRATIARALAQLGTGDLTGKVLLADEPASSLDTRHAARLIDTLRALAGRGLALLVAAHDLPWASAAAHDGLAITTAGGSVPLDAASLRDPETLGGVFGAAFERFTSVRGGRVVALPRLQAAPEAAG